jgi:hypothetical protein
VGAGRWPGTLQQRREALAKAKTNKLTVSVEVLLEEGIGDLPGEETQLLSV